MLRDYQISSINKVRENCARGLRSILVLPTGAGKTKTAVHGIVAPAIRKGRKVLWIAHRTELINQADGDLATSRVMTGILKAGMKGNPHAACQVASVQTLARRELPPASIVVVDECHHVKSATYMKVLQHYQDAGAIIIGLTATPARLDGRGLGDVFDKIVEEVTTRDLIQLKYLADYSYFAPSVPDLSDVKKSYGEFQQAATAKAMDKPTITGDIVKHYVKHLRGKRALVFAAGIEHSMNITRAFTRAGVNAYHLDGTTQEHKRLSVMAAFAAGRVSVVSNVNLFDEGFDAPECQGVIIARPTQSFVKHRQMIGRCMRPKSNGSLAIILDHAGNHARHGMPDDEVVWDLDGSANPDPGTKYKTCPVCYAVLAVHRGECEYCGHVFTRQARLGPEFKEGDLEKVKWNTQLKAALYETLMAKARAMGYKPGWAKRQYRARVGVWPRGWVMKIDEESFRQCQHRVLDGEYRCRHCGSLRT